MTRALLRMLAAETAKLEQAGLKKHDVSPAVSAVDLTGHDYLGLSAHPAVRDAAKAAGSGATTGGVLRGGSSAHRSLEKQVAELLRMPDAVLFGSGYLANVGLFESLFDSRDTIICDGWVHPSIADGIRLSSARPVPYRNADAGDLEDKLKRSRSARFRAVVTDAVFPFSGELADLEAICGLADRYDALVIVDDSLGVGVLGEGGRGLASLQGVTERVHVVTGSLAKGLGGVAGGFVASRSEIVDWLRQKSTAYLFSSKLPSPMVAAARAAIERVATDHAPARSLAENVERVRAGLVERGFTVLGGRHPLLVVLVGGAVATQQMVNQLAVAGVHVLGFCYPVVPEGGARIQVQVSSELTRSQIDRTLDAFERVGRALRVL